MIPVRYHEAASDELLSEIEFLEFRSEGLGRRFLNEVRRGEHLIAQFPESGAEIEPGIRKAPLSRFPHFLIYCAEPEGLLILAVAHPRRRPGYWRGRSL